MEKIRVAIADDHTIFRRGLVSILRNNEDFDIVFEAENGQELMDAIPMYNPQVVLMDLNMPVLDGIRATTKIKGVYPDLKIIIISMHDEDHFVSHLMELGANGYLLKDAHPDEVEKAIYTCNSEDYYYGAFLLRVMHNRLINKTTRKKTITLSSEINLTERELEVLEHICEGTTSPQIAEIVSLSVRTVEGHRNRIMEKTGTKNIAGLVAWAVRNGVV
ncbi:MAG: response regulator transcription factor [Arcicella sp.]|nr:response regulator transcription factor [Arcicella sp.]